SADLKRGVVPLGPGFRPDAGTSLARQRDGAAPTFSYGLWQWNRVTLAASVEIPLRRFKPFIETELQVPIGSGLPASNWPLRLVPGMRVSLFAGVSVLAAVEIGLT